MRASQAEREAKLRDMKKKSGKKDSDKEAHHEVSDNDQTEEDENQEMAPTQTKGGHGSVGKEGQKEESIRREQEEGEEDDGYQLVCHNKNLKRKMRERSRSHPPQGTKSLRTYSSSEDGELVISDDESMYDKEETDTQDNKKDDTAPLTFADVLRQTNC